MTARVLAISERHLRNPDHLASLADFTCTEGDEFDPRVVIDDPDLSLYCLDDEGKRAVFVQLPRGTDLTKVPFVHIIQGEQAERLIAVPYDAFLQLAAGLPEVENLVPIYNTGRSGSTLLSDAFNESGAVVSLSEPDAPTQFALLREPDGGRDAELYGLLNSTVRFLFKPSPYKRAAACAVKIRPEGIRAMELYQRTFPEAKSLLSYREAVGWVASFYRVFRGLGMAELETIGWWVEYLERFLKRSESEVRAYLGEGEDVPMVKALVVWWLFVMEDLLAQCERGVPALAVRYDDLNTHREAVLHGIFAYCGLPVSGVDRALRAFDRDAQAGTVLARAEPNRRNTLKLTDQQIADIHEVLQHHPVINAPDFMLPGTFTV